MTEKKANFSKKDWAEEILEWSQTERGKEKLAAAIKNSNLANMMIDSSFEINSEMLQASFNSTIRLD